MRKALVLLALLLSAGAHAAPPTGRYSAFVYATPQAARRDSVHVIDALIPYGAELPMAVVENEYTGYVGQDAYGWGVVVREEDCDKVRHKILFEISDVEINGYTAIVTLVQYPPDVDGYYMELVLKKRKGIWQVVSNMRMEILLKERYYGNSDE